jgi:transcriptional regulator with XRE-family HTH domain
MREALKLVIIRSGRPQFEIAAIAGMSESRLSRIVTGRVEPTAEERAKLASALSVSEDEIFASATTSLQADEVA